MEHNSVLTTQELSQYLKLNEKTILRMVQSGDLPGFKVGSQWRFFLSAIDKFLQNKMIGTFEHNTKDLFCENEINIPLSRFVSKPCINLSIEGEKKESVLAALAQIAVDAGIAVSAEEILSRLQERESMLSTAVGRGVAIPHPRDPSEGLFRAPGVVIGRSLEGVHFASPDGGKVHLFFMPCASDIALHLQLLSKIAMLLRDEDNLKKFMAADSVDAVMRVLLDSERKQFYNLARPG